MLVYPNKIIVFSSDLGKYEYCPMQLYMEQKIGKIQTKAMKAGTTQHKRIECEEKLGAEHLENVHNLNEALEMSRKTSSYIQSVDDYKMQGFFDNILLVGKPDFIAAHKNKIVIIERKPNRDSGTLYRGELMQIMSYALLAQKETLVDYDRIECYVDLYDKQTAEIVSRERVPILPENTYGVRKIMKAISEIAKGKVPEKTPHERKCAYCSYKEHCNSSSSK